jgi:Protein of unknown function (DUF664)
MTVPTDAEAATLMLFLDAQRASVLAIVDGLDDESLRATVLPSGWSPLGLIEHLGDAEWHWFQQVALGSTEEPPWAADDRRDEAPGFVTTRPVDVVFAYYRDQCRRANEVLASVPLSTPPVGSHGDPEMDAEITDLRRITLHLIEETARHAGHLDVVRELLDGRTGLGAR